MGRIFDILSKGDSRSAALIFSGLDAAACPPAPPENHERAVSPTPIRILPIKPPAGAPVLAFGTGNSQVNDQYRILRTKITQHERQPKVVLVSSPAVGDGKSITAVNLAAAFSLDHACKVLLIDCDLRRPSIHTNLGLPANPGLAQVLRGDCDETKAWVSAKELPDLYILSAGDPRPDPAELLTGTRWLELTAKARDTFQYVIFDAPPVEAVPEYILLQAAADGVVMVLRPDHTKRNLVKQALAAVPADKLLGVLLNCVPPASLRRHAAENYYGRRDSAKSRG